MTHHALSLSMNAQGRYVAACSCGGWKSTNERDEETVFRAFELHLATSH